MAILRSVAKSDTFEKQRQTINQIAADLFAIGGGGSDLSTGLLRLGDGSRTDPSLSFVNDTSVGIFRPEIKTLAFVSDGKKLHQIQNESSLYYRNVILQKNVLDTGGLEITDGGQNYDPGNFSDISVIGGTGQAATLDITVSPFDGTTTSGSGYTAPDTAGGTGGINYSNVELIGGSGSDIVVTIEYDAVTGGFSETSITSYGDELYQINDVLTLPTSVTGVTATVTEASNELTVSSTAGIYRGFIVQKVSGAGSLESPITGDITVSDVVDGTTLIVSSNGSVSGSATFNFNAPWGSGTGYSFTIDKLGIVTNVAVNQEGEGYSIDDTLSIFNLDLTNPIEYIVDLEGLIKVTFTTTVSSGTFVPGNTYSFSRADPFGGAPTTISADCEEVIESGGEIILVTFSVTGTDSISGGDTIGALEVDTTENVNRYTIDTGDGNPTRYPNLSLYVNNTYRFDYSAAGSHPFRFSIHPRGIWNTYEESVTVTEGSTDFTVSDASSLLVGMSVERGEGGGINDTGDFAANSVIESINGNTITLNIAATSSGSTPVLIRGVEYSGEEVVYENSYTDIRPTETTPTLYYYCSQHANMGGVDATTAQITIDVNNPKTFGSGLEILVTDIVSNDNVTLNVSSGDVNAISFTSESADITTVNSTDVFSDKFTASVEVNTTLVNSPGNLLLKSTGLTSPVSIKGQKVSIVPPATGASALLEFIADTGDINTSGTIKTSGAFNSSDILKIEDNQVYTTGSNDLLLTPAANRVAKIGGVTALIIPAGDTSGRPGPALVENGAIRYNTQTTQYEGYSSQTSSWSSLGGIRDLDGNTYITAEETVGANDDTFYLYNGNANTIKISPTRLSFETLKKVASLNTSAPAYTEWRSNTPVSLGQYLKYRNRIYEVTGAGITATDGNAPTHTSGELPNNTALLTYFTTAVSNLLFQEINEVQIDPFGDTYLTISGDLRLRKNIIATDINDLKLKPNSGKKIVCDATSTLVVPVGDDNQRGSPTTGSIRFNTSSSQFEGYDDNGNWGSLGGVKDVDQNTYIIPETSPGANENILYFYNDNVNTVQLSTSSLDLTNIDSITSINNSSLSFEFSEVTFDNNALTIDNTDPDRTFLYNTKQYFELGMSGGLTIDPLITFEDNGDIFYNTAFGSGNLENLKLLNNELTEFEIRDFKVQTSKFNLIKGTTNNGSALLYNKTNHKGSKVMVILENTLSNKSSFMEFSVIDNGTDIFYNEYGSLNSSEDAAIAVFDFDIDGNARITLTLTNDHAAGDTVRVTVVSQIIK